MDAHEASALDKRHYMKARYYLSHFDLYTALLGGEVIIQLSNGSKIKLKVRSETQNGTKVRLRGKGYDRGDGSYGDLIITYNVTLPTNLTERQKQLLNEMRNAG